MRTLLILVFLSLGWRSMAQQHVVASRLNVQAGVSLALVQGSEKNTSGNYEAPSFFVNFNESYGLSINASYRLGSIYSAGIDITGMQFGSWFNDESTRFAGAKHTMVAISPRIQIQTRFNPHTTWNRITLVAGFGPSISFQNSELKNAPFVSVPARNDFLQSSYSAPGFSASGEFRINLSLRFVATMAVSYSQYWFSSHLYDDKSLRLISMTGMLGYRLMINRRFKYRTE